jgi:hypothetical protein
MVPSLQRQAWDLRSRLVHGEWLKLNLSMRFKFIYANTGKGSAKRLAFFRVVEFNICCCFANRELHRASGKAYT